MAIRNPWLNSFQRSYQDIRATLVEKLKAKVPEITDYSEGNIFMIIISVWAAIAEVLHYYIDNMARETFLTTARRYSSVYKHAKLVDYHIKSANPASVDLTLYLTGNEPIKAPLAIPINTEFQDINGNRWVTTKAYTWTPGTYSIPISVTEKQPASTGDMDFGVVNHEDIMVILTNVPAGKKYVEGSLVLKVGDQTWTQVESFAYSTAYDKVYKVEVNNEMLPVILFGNGKFGMKPEIGSRLSGRYYITTGANGNVGRASFDKAPTFITNAAPTATVTNYNSATSGSDYEGFETLKEHIPLSIRTLGVAITKEDYEAIAKIAAGVDKSYVNYICGRFVEIYITPEGGGIASQTLLEAVAKTLSKSKVITTSVTIKPTREAMVYLEADITGHPSYSPVDIDNQIRRALISKYNYNTSEINLPVRLSDIYSLIDQQPLVNYLKITKLYLIPLVYAVSEVALQAEMLVTSYAQAYYNYKETLVNIVEVLTSSTFKVTDTHGAVVNGTFGSPFTMATAEFSVTLTLGYSSSRYNVGDKYQFSVQAMNDDLLPFNYTIPIIRTENIKLNIHETV